MKLNFVILISCERQSEHTPREGVADEEQKKSDGGVVAPRLVRFFDSLREAGPMERGFNTLLFGSDRPTYSSYRYWQYVRPFYWVILAAVVLGTFGSLALLLAMCGHHP